MPPIKIVFFGLGAVGSNLLVCFSELAERDGVPVRFVVYTIDPDAARDALFHAERLFDRIEHALDYARVSSGTIAGVITGEDLARLLPRVRADAVRRDLVAWDIDLFESVRDASEG